MKMKKKQLIFVTFKKNFPKKISYLTKKACLGKHSESCFLDPAIEMVPKLFGVCAVASAHAQLIPRMF